MTRLPAVAEHDARFGCSIPRCVDRHGVVHVRDLRYSQNMWCETVHRTYLGWIAETSKPPTCMTCVVCAAVVL